MLPITQFKKRIKGRCSIGIGLILLLAVAVFFIVGCGKKGAPVAPTQLPLPVVVDLQAAVEGDMVTLSWSRQPKGVSSPVQIAGYFVNRSKTPLSEADCADCPILFQRIADISTIVAPEDSDKPRVQYSEAVEKGHRYIYMVTVYTPAGVTGMASNRVEFIH